MTERLLSVLAAPMEAAFALCFWMTSSAGWAVILLAAAVALLAHPLRRRGQIVEKRLAEKNAQIKKDVAALDKNLSAESRFYALEEIYKRRHFHPIHNTLAAASFLFQLPFLVSALLALTGDLPALRSSFWMVGDLSQPDGLAAFGDFSLNILPLVLLMISIAEAKWFYRGDSAAAGKYMLLSALIFILVYPLPAAPVLYWIALNLFAMLFAALFALARKPRPS